MKDLNAFPSLEMKNKQNRSKSQIRNSVRGEVWSVGATLGAWVEDLAREGVVATPVEWKPGAPLPKAALSAQPPQALRATLAIPQRSVHPAPRPRPSLCRSRTDPLTFQLTTIA